MIMYLKYSVKTILEVPNYCWILNNNKMAYLANAPIGSQGSNDIAFSSW